MEIQIVRKERERQKEYPDVSSSTRQPDYSQCGSCWDAPLSIDTKNTTNYVDWSRQNINRHYISETSHRGTHTYIYISTPCFLYSRFILEQANSRHKFVLRTCRYSRETSRQNHNMSSVSAFQKCSLKRAAVKPTESVSYVRLNPITVKLSDMQWWYHTRQAWEWPFEKNLNL